MCNKARLYLRAAMLGRNWLRLAEESCLFLYHFAVKVAEKGKVG
jgi:hypothetical protein